MEILGVGVPEFAFIILIALILLGPKDMIAAGKTIGGALRKFLTSPTWLALRKTGEELQQLPTKLVREAGLDELQKDIQGMTNSIKPIDFRKTFDESQVFSTSNVTPVKPAEAVSEIITPQNIEIEESDSLDESASKPEL
ncbi:MAG: twin-arginine translocase TatA/TatE family subunit [Chloroflexota bacterium]